MALPPTLGDTSVLFCHNLMLQIAQTRTLDELLRRLVDGLASLPEVALARVWLAKPGDICDVCPMRAECPTRITCLHLVASAGTSRFDPADDWSRVEGDFRRMPIGVRKVGRIGRGESLVVNDVAGDGGWIVRPGWAKREGIRSFGGHPLVYRGETLGVLGVFARVPIGDDDFVWFRMLADHAAAAIANARAFDEIDRLRRRLEDENETLREDAWGPSASGDLVGPSAALQAVSRQIDLVAPTDASVLILGESGTGKELVALEIHRRSRRAEKPMIRVNCASIPRELYESEFFGHVRGAFTGAIRDRHGRFELADGGTIFLDEVGEIPLELQSKLLRVLQEGEFERIGEERTRKVDARVIAATNRDLKAEATAGRFRQDLYYRLNVFPITVAPLRERPEDVPPLAEHFLAQAARRLGRKAPRLTAADREVLAAYPWPGNVRELQNAVERAAIVSRGGRLSFDLPRAPVERAPAPRRDRSIDPGALPTLPELRRRERDAIAAALEKAGGRIYGPGGAAELLGVKPTTLSSRIQRHRLKGPR